MGRPVVVDHSIREGTSESPGNLMSGLFAMFRQILFSVVCAATAYAQKAPPAQPFSTYEGCTYIAQLWNDGDSFHVRMPDGKEQVLRLYFVDVPESENSFPARVAEQAAYFSITSKQALGIGIEASAFTEKALSSHLWSKLDGTKRWGEVVCRVTTPSSRPPRARTSRSCLCQKAWPASTE